MYCCYTQPLTLAVTPHKASKEQWTKKHSQNNRCLATSLFKKNKTKQGHQWDLQPTDTETIWWSNSEIKGLSYKFPIAFRFLFPRKLAFHFWIRTRMVTIHVTNSDNTWQSHTRWHYITNCSFMRSGSCTQQDTSTLMTHQCTPQQSLWEESKCIMYTLHFLPPLHISPWTANITGVHAHVPQTHVPHTQ